MSVPVPAQAEKKRRQDEAAARARAASQEAQRRLEQLQVRSGAHGMNACTHAGAALQQHACPPHSRPAPLTLTILMCNLCVLGLTVLRVPRFACCSAKQQRVSQCPQRLWQQLQRQLPHWEPPPGCRRLGPLLPLLLHGQLRPPHHQQLQQGLRLPLRRLLPPAPQALVQGLRQAALLLLLLLPLTNQQ